MLRKRMLVSHDLASSHKRRGTSGIFYFQASALLFLIRTREAYPSPSITGIVGSKLRNTDLVFEAGTYLLAPDFDQGVIYTP